MPSVGDIDQLMLTWSHEYALARHTPDYFAQVWKSVAEHLQNAGSSGCTQPDFERSLSELIALMHWVRPPPVGSALRGLVAGGSMPEGVVFQNPERYGPSIALKMHASELLARLARDMRQRSAKLELENDELQRWRRLLSVLRERFDVVIYNLNYDAIALSCWPGAFTGFAGDGKLDSASIHQREWEGIFHLHGSVHFSLREHLGEEIVWKDDLNGVFFDCDEARSADERSDGRDFPRTTLVAGGFKLDQLLVEPFHSYQGALVRDAYRADAILLGGYGFADAHVNRALKNAIISRRETRPPVLVLDWADDHARVHPISFRFERWAHVLMDVLHAPGPNYAPPGHVSPLPPKELKAARACEVSPMHRTALWYGGFLAAAPAADRLGAWLGGGDDTLLAGK
ncbi:MAG: SIR2 family protein [Hyphomonadaceae bacterium]